MDTTLHNTILSDLTAKLILNSQKREFYSGQRKKDVILDVMSCLSSTGDHDTDKLCNVRFTLCLLLLKCSLQM